MENKVSEILLINIFSDEILSKAILNPNLKCYTIGIKRRNKKV